MKDFKRKLIAALGAVTLAVTSALPASAVYDMSTDNVRVIKSLSNNDPYLNITLNNGGLSTSGLKFTLKKDGKAIATLNGGMSKASITDKSLGILDITGIRDGYNLLFEFRDKLTKRNVKLGSLTSSMPDLVYQGGELISGGILGKDSVLSIYPNVELILAYCTAEVVETKTLLPNKLVVSVSKRYAAYGDHDADVRLLNPKNYKNFTGFSHYKLDQAGDHQFDVPAGEYGLEYCNGGSFDDIATVAYNTRQEYVKLRIPATCIQNVKKTASGLIYYDRDTNYAMSKSAGTPYVNFIFRSGSVVTADVPDANGNIEIWVKKGDYPKLFFMTNFSDGKGGLAYGYVRLPYRKDVVEYKMDFPKTGVTLYNVPAGNYTVEVNDSAYQLTGNTLKVTNTQSMQKINLKLSKKQDTTTKDTTKTTTTTTTVTTTKPNGTTTSGSKTETTTTVSESSVPAEESSSDTEDASSEEESSLEEESSSENDEALSVKTIGADTVSSAEDSSSQTETSEAEKEDSGSTKTILIICGISLLALIVIIMIIILLRKKRKDQEK